MILCTVIGVGVDSGEAVAEESPETITLERALELASTEQEGFLINREELSQRLLARDRAWAALMPTIAFTGTYTHSDREIAFNDRVLQLQDSLEGRFSAIMTLIQAGAYANIGVATHSARAAERAATWTAGTLAFEVARAYYAALAGRALVAAAERTVATAEEHLSAMEARRSAGEVLAIDEGRARLAVVEGREGLTRAQNISDGSLDSLAFLIGREPPIRIPPATAPLAATGAEPDLQQNLDSRPDLQAASLEVRAARAALRESWLDYLPTVTLTGSYRITQNTGFSGDPLSWQLIMTLDWVLFDGGLRRATRRERASQHRATQLRLSQLDRQARHQLRQARRDLDTAIATLRTTEERRTLAAETRSQIFRRYQAGIDSSLELVEADDSLSQAEIELVSRQLAVALARLDLLQAFGLDPLGRELER